jgi:RNA polymerase-binding transcription factor DksA
MLTTQEIEQYQKQLEARRAKLMGQIEGDSEPHNPGNDITSDNEEEASEAEAFADQLAIAQALRDEVQEIDLALERIREKKYGICTKCGKEISKEVLQTAPESTLCESCKLGE